MDVASFDLRATDVAQPPLEELSHTFPVAVSDTLPSASSSRIPLKIDDDAELDLVSKSEGRLTEKCETEHPVGATPPQPEDEFEYQGRYAAALAQLAEVFPHEPRARLARWIEACEGRVEHAIEHGIRVVPTALATPPPAPEPMEHRGRVLVTEVRPLSTLLEEYHAGSPLRNPISELGTTWGIEGWRAVYGDGNCFHRGFAIRFVEILSDTPVNVMADVWERLSAVVRGMSDARRREFEPLTQFLKQVYEHAPNPAHPAPWRDLFRLSASWVERRDLSDLLVAFLREAMLQEYRANAAFRDYFEDDAQFAQRLAEVATMGQEADHIDITALMNRLDYGVILLQVDAKNVVSRHVINEMCPHELPVLLYRPGHYDILYKARR